MYEIGDNIRNFRKFRRMTQQELAVALNVTVTSVANWERGNSNIGLHVFLSLCKILGATPNQICGIDKCPELEKFLEEQRLTRDIKRDQAAVMLAYAKRLDELRKSQTQEDSENTKEQDDKKLEN